jgi:gamma-glutamyltranspeptidase/glutathione hydrolase
MVRILLSFFTCIMVLPLAQGAEAFPYSDRGRNGMVVSAHLLASQVGVETLKQGGNAVDAAVSTTLAISVVEPFSAGIGGGGFLLFYEGKNNTIKALDFRERAPLAAYPQMYLDQTGQVIPRASTVGYRAVATPGTVAGLYEIQRRYGVLPWRQVVEPAAKLAAEGFPVSWRLAQAIQRSPILQDAAARAIFTRDGQQGLEVGDRLIQRDLAYTLQQIGNNPKSFYTGTIARAIARTMAQQGGLVTLTDLEQYRPIWREPVCGGFKQVRVCSMPPPSSGGVHLLQMLNLLADTDFKSLGWHHPDVLHRMIEGMRIAYADRAEYLGDPDFVTVPVAALISPAYAQQRRQDINPNVATPSSQRRPGNPKQLQQLNRESNDTSHLSVVDQQGNAVSLTFTVNLGFGAGVVVPGTGIVLNNEMDDFAIAPGVPNAFGLVGNQANAIAPGKTPLSSMTPTIATEQGKLRLVTGAPGGSTIITTVLQVVLNVLVYDMDARQAIAAPRLHHQWLPDRVRVERFGFDSLTLENLRQRGHQIEESGSWGNGNIIVRSPDGWLQGAADPRGEGVVAGF